MISKDTLRFVESLGITDDTISIITNIDPTENKKYTKWISKVFVKEGISIELLRNYIEEFHTAVSRNNAKIKDIYSLTSFEELKTIVDEANNSESAKLKELENEYDTVLDNDDLSIFVPYTHEASRKIALSNFIVPEKSDVPWCTAYKNSSHFNSYFYDRNITFYYVKVKSKDMMSKLNRIAGCDLRFTAILVYNDNAIEAYDALDKKMTDDQINKYRKVVGI